MPKMITEQQIQENMFNQIKAEVHERNEYRKLLEECLIILNQLKNTHNENSIGMTSHKLATKIEVLFEKKDKYFDLS